MTVGLAASVLALFGLGGVSWLVAERSRVERHSAVVQGLNETRRLQDAARGADEGDLARWSEALASLERVKGLLAQGGDAAQKREADELRDSITFERDLARKGTEWLSRLTDVRSTKADDAEGLTADAGYSAIFREAGIDPDVLPAEEVGSRVRALRPMLAQGLVAALDDWSAVRRGQRNDEAGRKRLVAAARAADPDAWRNGLREALDQANGKDRLAALRELTDRADRRAPRRQP